MFGNKSLSALDIGNDSIKAVELKKQFGRVSLKTFNSTPNRSDGYKNGEIIRADLLEPPLKTVLKGMPRDVIFSCCGTSMMVKKIRIPKMDQDFIGEQIRWEAEQYIPFNIDEVNIEFEVIDDFADNETMGLLLVAIFKNKVSSYANFISQAGYSAKIADVSGFALANCYTVNYPTKHSDAVILLDIGAFYTNLVIMDNAKVIYTRDIQFGGAKYDEELAKNMGVSQSEANTIKRSENLSSFPDLAADTLVSVNEKLALQILGSVDFFKNSEDFNNPFSKIYVTGGGSLVSGLTQSLSQTLGVKVEFLNVFKKIAVPKRLLRSSDKMKLQYMSAVSIGLAVRELY